MYRVDVRADDRILEPIRLADEFTRIDVDRDQCLGLIDHDIATRLQPHFRPERLVDLRVQSIFFKDRCVLQMQFHAVDQGRLELVHEVENGGELRFVIQADGPVIGRKLIAQKPLYQIQVAMNQRRRRLLFALPADVGPEVSKKTDILDKFFFTATFGRRTHDESTGQPVPMLVDDSFQARAFFVRSDFP